MMQHVSCNSHILTVILQQRNVTSIVTCITVNDFESENLFVCCKLPNQASFVLFDRKYYTDSCSATVVILINVAAPKNCTITRQQCYFKTVHRLNISTEPCPFVSDDCLLYVRHQTDKDFALWSMKLISKISEDDISVLSVSAALDWYKQLQT